MSGHPTTLVHEQTIQFVIKRDGRYPVHLCTYTNDNPIVTQKCLYWIFFGTFDSAKITRMVMSILCKNIVNSRSLPTLITQSSIELKWNILSVKWILSIINLDNSNCFYAPFGSYYHDSTAYKYNTSCKYEYTILSLCLLNDIAKHTKQP